MISTLPLLAPSTLRCTLATSWTPLLTLKSPPKVTLRMKRTSRRLSITSLKRRPLPELQPRRTLTQLRSRRPSGSLHGHRLHWCVLPTAVLCGILMSCLDPRLDHPYPTPSLLCVYHLWGQISRNLGRGRYALGVPRCVHCRALSSLREQARNCNGYKGHCQGMT
jgi:hypothetical protein